MTDVDTTDVAEGATAPALPGPHDGRWTSEGERRLLEEILSQRLVRSVYQPVVDLASGAVVAYEALSRGPEGSPLERPDRLFAAARGANALAELDQACQVAAVTGASDAGLRSPLTLLVNVEPEVSSPALPAIRTALRQCVPSAELRVIVELTERALTARPAELLSMVAALRAFGWGIALDDVGAEPASLALLPILRPDVIKLDLRLVQDRPSPHVAQIVSSVNAEAERSGAVVLAEGIETPEHLAIARGLGATLGQGWLLGRPEPLPEPLPQVSIQPLPVAAYLRPPAGSSPFALVAAQRPVRQATKPLLIEVSKHLEQQALLLADSALVLAAFQTVDYFTPATRRRYAELASTASFVGALGAGMPAAPSDGVRGGALAAGDVVLGEWDIAVIGSHFAAALVARDLGDTGAERSRRFEYVLTHDRELAVQVASSLMSRLQAAGPVIPRQRS